MTDLSSSPRQIAPTETMGDVLASIRRLIAQDDVRPARSEPVLGRSAPRAEQSPRIAEAAIAPAFVRSPRLEPAESAPLRLHQDALIPPAEEVVAPTLAPRDGSAPRRLARLRLATPADAEPSDAEGATDIGVAGDRMARILRSASFHDETPQERPGAAAEGDTIVAERASPISDSEGGAGLVQPAPAVTPELVSADAASVDTVEPRGNSGPAPAAEPSRAQAVPRPVEDAEDTTALHLFAPADEDIPNSSILRSLLREAIRQELQGEMGGRFSRNLRRVIRQEVAYAIAEAARNTEPG